MLPASSLMTHVCSATVSVWIWQKSHLKPENKKKLKMKIFLAVTALLALVVFCRADIVEDNGICIEEIKSLEACLKAAGQGQGWCEIGKAVKL